MINVLKLWHWSKLIEAFSQMMWLKPRKEDSSIVYPLHKCVDGISISLNTRYYHRPIFILQGFWLLDRLGPSAHCFAEDPRRIIHMESYIIDSISVSFQMLGELFFTWIQRRLEGIHYLPIGDHMGCKLSLTCFQTLVSKIFKPKSTCIIGCGLFSISYIES